jgi:hypothetical protein
LAQPAPQAPQLVTLRRSVSQPLLAFESQSPKLTSHVDEHRPPAQLVPPCAFMHESAQLPQVMVWSAVLASQPLPGSPSQSA